MARVNGWTKEELTTLKKHYIKSEKEKVLSLLPRRSWSAIHHKAERLGIKRNKDFQYKGMINNTLTNNPMKNPENVQKVKDKLITTGIGKTIGKQRREFIEEKGNKCEACNEVFPTRRLHLHYIMNALETAQCTSLVTSEVPVGSSGLSRDSISEFLADGVITLSLDPTMDRRKLSVVKMRSTKHTLRPQDIEIGRGGIILKR